MMPDNAIDFYADEADVIVVGTGMGGATIGYALAKAGKKVLFCESGSSRINPSSGLRGDYAESFFKPRSAPQPKHRDILINSGRWADILEDRSLPKRRGFIPYLGSGTGGSSALYGMAMERFAPADFHPRANFPGSLGANLPDHWPIGYDDLEPYYNEAEKLFGVRGTLDPLRADEKPASLTEPPPLSAANKELFDFFSNHGLHPYRLPMACEFKENCQGCQGFLCAKRCKNDSEKICLEPAINQYGAKLLDNCHVIKLEYSDGRVSGVQCNWQNKEITLHAPLVILAAGALKTPQILLKSSSRDWPRGLSNESGLVGKNLMRHYIDLYAVPTKIKKIEGHMKEIALNDLYFKKGEKLGNIQSFGLLPKAPILVETLQQELREKSAALGFLFGLGKPIVGWFISLLLSHKVVLATIMEDLPYLDNKVTIDEKSDQLIIEYNINKNDKKRIGMFRAAMGKLLKPYRFIVFKQAENNERIAHACGTCRFGNDPGNSVLNAENRAHGIPNLYVVDGSFFPSSSGTNPALTIAANALRVADHILGKI